ncbi:PAS PAC sensor signal transduction histidine kinase, putative [Babesia ovis]|uniref:PAS PAC sensor signal transduction histidine kinase, putative n=1 Tax=Babesia ovis TaxID=5869 RepID=A0A9W5TBB3_BABOV|nr:PAS PAC sensor signal transduction histidine kinase, putative [Babesia ovis]
MIPVIDAIVNSLGELSKRKVKRSARIWTKRLGDLFDRRDRINTTRVPTIVKHIVENQLETHRKSQELLQHFVTVVDDLENLSSREIFALCYAFSVIGEEHLTNHILHKHCESAIAATKHDIQGFTDVIKAISFVASREQAALQSDASGALQPTRTLELCDQVIEVASQQLEAFQHNVYNKDHAAAGEVVTHSVFLAQLYNKSYTFVSGTCRWVDAASICSRVRISQKLSTQQHMLLSQQIASSSYRDTLSTLRYIYHMRYPQEAYLQQLYTRLCATTGASTHMCRREALETLGYFLQQLKDNNTDGNDKTKALLEYLSGIQRSGVLTNGHVSTHRWNYPVMLTRNG